MTGETILMPNKPTKSAVLRAIASDGVEKCLPDLTPEEKDGLITSVVRQWITHEGHAFLMNEEAERCYLVLRQTADGYEMTVNEVDGDALNPFLCDWQIDRELIPEIVHDLNLRQSAEVTNRNGLALRFSVNPQKRSISIEQT